MIRDTMANKWIVGSVVLLFIFVLVGVLKYQHDTKSKSELSTDSLIVT